MAKKKDKQKQQGRPTQNSKGVNWDLVWKVLASVFAFAGSLATVYDLVGKIRSDAQTFYAFILPGLILVVWSVILLQLMRKKNPYLIPLLAVTILGGVVGAIGWQSYNRTQEDKVIVLVAQFDGPEETYGLHDQIMEDLLKATRDYGDTVIIDGKDLVTAGEGSEYARKLGEKENADLVIWAWYRPTENPNITIHIENLSPTIVTVLQESEAVQPQATLSDLESFELQKQIGSETSTLITFVVGLSRYQAGDYQKSLECFQQVLSKPSKSTFINLADLYFYIGFSHIRTNQPERAIEAYTKAIELIPTLSSAFVNRGFAYFNLAQYERAIQDYDKALEIDPNDTSSYGNRGLSYWALGQTRLAIEDFNKVTELNPRDASAYLNRGVAQWTLGEYEQAIQDFSKTIEIDPTDASAYNNRGFIYDELGQYERAIEDYDKSIVLAPNDASTYNNRGGAYRNLRKYKLAIKDFNKSIELNQDNAAAYTNRGITYWYLGENEQAIQEYAQAIKIDPNYASAYNNRGVLYGDLEQFALAIQDFDKAIEIHPQYADAYYNRGRAYAKLGKSAEAEADFKKYEELTGEKP